MKRFDSVRLTSLVAFLLVISLALFGCGQSTTTSSTTGSTSTDTSSSGTGSSTATSTAGSGDASQTTNTQGTPLYTPVYQPNGKEIGVIKTSKGTIRVKFYPSFAPGAVGNFVELARKGFYNGLRFHRYVADFIIQGGDPKTKGVSAKVVADADANQTQQFGTGGPGYALVDEYQRDPETHVDGALGLARASIPNSSGSQFYFSLGTQSSLDGQYTVFGQTISGLDVVHKLRAGDEIVSVTIEHAHK